MALTEKTFAELITLIRGSSATRHNSSGLIESIAANLPRYDFDPVSLLPNGFLIEEQRTNLLTYSEELDNVAYTKAAISITANAIVSPDGAVTADKIVEDTATAQHQLLVSQSLTDNTIYTASIFMKAAERSWIRLSIRLKDGSFPGAYFDIANGVIGTQIGSPIDISIVDVGGGYYRCSVTVDILTGGTTPGVAIWLSTGDGVISYLGDGASGVHVWGFQLEEGNNDSSYIPTVASQVTRSADIASIDTLSPWYNAPEGTILIEGDLEYLPDGSVGYGLVLSDLTTDNRIQVARAADNKLQLIVVSGGVTLATLPSVASYVNGDSFTIALSWSSDLIMVSYDGVSVVSSSGAIAPIVSKLNLGTFFSSASSLNGHLKQVKYFPLAKTAAELEALSS